jgi:hypothetical protein
LRRGHVLVADECDEPDDLLERRRVELREVGVEVARQRDDLTVRQPARERAPLLSRRRLVDPESLPVLGPLSGRVARLVRVAACEGREVEAVRVEQEVSGRTTR